MKNKNKLKTILMPTSLLTPMLISFSTSCSISPYFNNQQQSSTNKTLGLSQDNAAYCDLHFKVEPGSSDEKIEGKKIIEIRKGNKFGVIKPPIASKPDYDFKNWYYLNGTTHVPVSNDTTIQDNLDLYPEFTPVVHNFEVTGGNKFINAYIGETKTDTSAWVLKDNGVSITSGVTYSVVDETSTPTAIVPNDLIWVSLDENNKLEWTNAPYATEDKDYKLKICATYNSTNYLSDEITIHVSKDNYLLIGGSTLINTYIGKTGEDTGEWKLYKNGIDITNNVTFELVPIPGISDWVQFDNATNKIKWAKPLNVTGITASLLFQQIYLNAKINNTLVAQQEIKFNVEHPWRAPDVDLADKLYCGIPNYAIENSYYWMYISMSDICNQDSDFEISMFNAQTDELFGKQSKNEFSGKIKIFYDDQHYDIYDADYFVGNGLTSLPDNFMYGCNFVEKITFGDDKSKLISIGDQFMYGNANFNSPIILPNTVQFIGDSFMEGCNAFNQTLPLPTNLKTIGDDFLYECSAFNNGEGTNPFTIGGNIQTVGNDFMYGCDSWTQQINVNIPADWFKYDGEPSQTLATTTTSPAWLTNGIPIGGTYKDEFVDRFKQMTIAADDFNRKLVAVS